MEITYKHIVILLLVIVAILALRILLKIILSYFSYIRLRKQLAARNKKNKDIEPAVLATSVNKNDSKVIKLNDPTKQLAQNENKMKIVGVRKPVGFWTNFVTQNAISRLDMSVFDPNEGFWVNFVNSQKAAAHKRGQIGR